MANSTMHEVFGDAIYEYTTDTALSDGVLTEPYPDRWPNLFMSADVTAACETADLRTSDKARTFDQVTIPFLMDVIMQAQVPKNHRKLSEGSIITLDHTIAGEVFIALNERGGLTVMTPSEY
jgi:hypothetical protein